MVKGDGNHACVLRAMQGVGGMVIVGSLSWLGYGGKYLEVLRSPLRQQMEKEADFR